MAKNRKGPNSEAPKPAPGTILPVKACFLAILDKEVRFGRYEYKLNVKPSNSRFKLLLNTIGLQVRNSLTMIEAISSYSCSHCRCEGSHR